jgi:hypothetical protein
MDAHDRNRIVRRGIEVDLHERDCDRSELATLRLSLREPIEESSFGRGPRVADDSFPLFASAGSSWGI